MKIVLLANNEQKSELIRDEQPVSTGITWLSDLSQLKDLPDVDACIDLLFDETTQRINKLSELRPQVVVINSVINPLNELTSGFIRINGWNTFLQRPTIEASAVDGLKKKAEDVFSVFSKRTDWIPDIPGFVSARVIACIINEAYFTLEEKVSTKEEIDTAMKLGTNYPYGPFEWCEKIGVKKIYALLNRLSEDQERYKPAALLTKEAIA